MWRSCEARGGSVLPMSHYQEKKLKANNKRLRYQDPEHTTSSELQEEGSSMTFYCPHTLGSLKTASKGAAHRTAAESHRLRRVLQEKWLKILERGSERLSSQRVRVLKVLTCRVWKFCFELFVFLFSNCDRWKQKKKPRSDMCVLCENELVVHWPSWQKQKCWLTGLFCEFVNLMLLIYWSEAESTFRALSKTYS